MGAGLEGFEVGGSRGFGFNYGLGLKISDLVRICHGRQSELFQRVLGVEGCVVRVLPGPLMPVFPQSR